MVLLLANLDLNFVGGSKLVLDVHSRPKATEHSTTDHDANLCAQELCFFHRVRRQNNRALGLTLVANDAPHELACNGIHAC